MKYLVVILGGASDLPFVELGDKTPLEAARMPVLARLAEHGRIGLAATTPEGFDSDTDVCMLNILGYEPARFSTGRAPLEAAGLGVGCGVQETVFLLSLVTTGQPGTVADGVVIDPSAGDITDREIRVLLGDLLRHWRQCMPELAETLTLHASASNRAIAVDASRRDYSGVVTTAPRALTGELWRDNMPEGGAADASQAMCKLIQASSEFLPKHEVNVARAESGLPMATLAWLWGQGVRPELPSFHARFGLKGAMITSSNVLAGIALQIGWDRLHVPGLTSAMENDYVAQGEATTTAIERYDIVCTHVAVPGEAAERGDVEAKVGALEKIDKAILGPAVEKLRSYGDPENAAGADGWRVLVMPDHAQLCTTRKADATPVPFAMSGAWIRSAVQRRMSERDAAQSDLRIQNAYELMEYFLRGGLASVKLR